MAQDKVRIGFVGVGGMGQCAHLRNYASMEECEVVAIAELRPETGARVAARYGVPHVYADHEAMLAAEQLDGIVASQPFSRHGILVPELRKTGLPVFTEKPLAASVAVGEEIVAADEAHDGFLMIGYHKRSDPATMYAKGEIEALSASGELGALTYVRLLMPAGDWIASGFVELIKGNDAVVELSHDPPAADMDEATYQTYTGFVNYYIHQVNLMRHLLGEDYGVRYADSTGRLVVGESDSGVPCVIEMSPYSTTIDWQEQALVCFERGWVKLDLPAPLASNRPGRVEVFKDAPETGAPATTIPQLPWVHAMRQQAANFLAAVRGERPPMCDAPTALKDLQVAREYVRMLTGK